MIAEDAYNWLAGLVLAIFIIFLAIPLLDCCIRYWKEILK